MLWVRGAKTLGGRGLPKTARKTHSKFKNEANRPTVTQELIAGLGQPILSPKTLTSIVWASFRYFVLFDYSHAEMHAGSETQCRAR
jgi:hypothetical protein